MSEKHFNETATLRRHRVTLAILLIAESLFYLLGTGFVWLIVFSLVWVGYRLGDADSRGLLILACATGLGGLLPLFAAYALLRRHAWVKWSVLLTCFAALALAALGASEIMQQHLSRNRLLVLVIQSGISLALSLYGFWFVSRRESLTADAGPQLAE